MASLPSVAELIEDVMMFDNGGSNTIMSLLNPMVYTAQVCEKLGEHGKTLIYAAAALETDLTKGGTRLPSDRIPAYSLRGRAHAALGHTTEAAVAFESAADEAHRYGFFLWEMFALRDLKLLVLDGMGHSDHGSRRLGAVLRLLKGPDTMLNPMLKGCDAVQLMALPPPDSACIVVYGQGEEDPAVTVLRQELSGLKLKALKSRARELGVSEEALEDADDEADVKAAVISLCTEAAMAGEGGGGEEVAALRADLAQLKLKALKKRAREAGVSADALEDADDADDVKQAVADLIVGTSQDAARGHTAGTDKPHFGSALKTAQPLPEPQHAAAAKHVMLSYQWDHQAQVKRAYDMLTQLGVKCWMDISGGMGADIYESMAEGHKGSLTRPLWCAS